MMDINIYEEILIFLGNSLRECCREETFLSWDVTIDSTTKNFKSTNHTISQEMIAKISNNIKI